jgi:hypothetical protein
MFKFKRSAPMDMPLTEEERIEERNRIYSAIMKDVEALRRRSKRKPWRKTAILSTSTQAARRYWPPGRAGWR